MPMPSRLPAFAGTALVALGLALAAPAAHADDVTTTTATPTTTIPAGWFTAATDSVTTGAEETTTTTAPATETTTTTTAPVTETTTTTAPVTETSTTTTTSTVTATGTATATATTTDPSIPVPTVTADECGIFADMLTVPDTEGIHYVAPSPDPEFFDDLDLGPGTYPAAFVANDLSDLGNDLGEDGPSEYHVVIEARAEVEGPALSTTRLTLSIAPCPSAGYPPVTAKAGPGTVTFTNPAGNRAAAVAWGDPEADKPDGEEVVAPGRSVTVTTTREHIAWIAFNEESLAATPAPHGRSGAPSSATDVPRWAARSARAPRAPGAEPLRRTLSPALRAPSGAVIAVDPTDIDPDELADLREFELSLVDMVLGSGELDVPQVAATTPTTTVTVTATSTSTAGATPTALAYTGSSDVRPLAGLSLGLVLAGAGLVVAAGGRVRIRRH